MPRSENDRDEANGDGAPAVNNATLTVVTDTTVTRIGHIVGPVHVGSGNQINIINRGE